MLLRIFSIVFPIFAIIAAGWLYARYRRPQGGLDMAFANQLNMDIFVPALVFAALAALALGGLNIAVWPPLYAAIKLLGDVAIPLLLFSLGVRMAVSRFSDLKIGLIGAVACPVMGMALAWLLVQVLALDAHAAAMLLVFGALPPAVLNYVFAERYQQEPAKVASLVMLGNLAALLFVPLALAMSIA